MRRVTKQEVIEAPLRESGLLAMLYGSLPSGGEVAKPRLRTVPAVLCLAALLAAAALGVGAASSALTPALAAEPCPNEALRAESDVDPATEAPFSLALPECRAYEMVSPPYMGGSRPETQALSADGSRLIVQSLGTFAGSENQLLITGNEYEFTRSEDGWQAAPIGPPTTSFTAGEFLSASRPALSRTLFLLRRPTESVKGLSFYVRDPPLANGSCSSGATRAGSGCFIEIGPSLPPSYTAGPPDPTAFGRGGGTPFIAVWGASADLSHIAFAYSTFVNGSEDLWPGDTTLSGNHTSLYEYVLGAGNAEPKLVGVSNVGVFDRNTEADLISDCQTSLGGGSSANFLAVEEDVYNAVSTSGETVFFTAMGHNVPRCEAETTAPAVSELYARVGEQKTLAISEPFLPPGEECTGACAGAAKKPGFFRGASEDGSKVFFLTEQPLLNGDTDATDDLYLAEIEGQGATARVSKLVQVSVGEATVNHPTAGAGAEVLGVARVSEDGSRVYFVAKGELTEKPNGLGKSAVAGQPNLYVYDTETEEAAFVATLAPGACAGSNSCTGDAADWQAEDARPVQATPDGRFLIFNSVADLTPDDTSTATQVFEYDAADGELIRVSVGQCQTSGSACTAGERFNADGNTNAYPAQLTAAQYDQTDSPVEYQSTRQVSADGSHVFFNSAAGLTPAAVPGVQGVYEYSWSGSLSAGDVHLLANSPVGANDTTFVGTDSSGEDTFIKSRLQLVPRDTNTGLDLYDARVDGGFPSPAAPVGCEGEHCQGPSPPPPAGRSAVTQSFGGPGNEAAPLPARKRCAKGSVRRHGRCVKKQMRRHHHKRHHRRALSHKHGGGSA